MNNFLQFLEYCKNHNCVDWYFVNFDVNYDFENNNNRFNLCKATTITGSPVK